MAGNFTALNWKCHYFFHQRQKTLDARKAYNKLSPSFLDLRKGTGVPFFCWGVVELVRRLTLDQKVVGSSPTAPANLNGGIV